MTSEEILETKAALENVQCDFSTNTEICHLGKVFNGEASHVNIMLDGCMYPSQKSSLHNRLLNVCYVPATSTCLNRLLFFFLLQPLTVLMKQTRQAVRAVKQSILLRCLWLVQFNLSKKQIL
jgi:hypothetical protein